MAAAPQTIDELFKETVKGKFPLADGPSTAKFWVPTMAEIDVLKKGAGPKAPKTVVTEAVVGQFVPRPDRSIGTLRALSVVFGILGFDHFYLRSNKTGIIKLLTLGGFGLWWLWDALQLFSEGDRVLNYGMSTPFDYTTGIGQGMITDKPTNYAQRSDWALWILSLLFGVAGGEQLFLGNTWAFVRFFFMLAVVIVPLSTFLAKTASSGYLEAIKSGWWGLFLTLPWLVVFIAGVFFPLFKRFWTVAFESEKIMSDGLETPDYAQKVLGWWHRMYEDADGNVEPEDKADYEVLKAAWDPPANLSPEDVKKKFWIKYNEEISDGPASRNAGFPFAILALRPLVLLWQKIWFMISPTAKLEYAEKRARKLAAGASEAARQIAAAQSAAGGLASAAAAAPVVHVGGARNDEPALSNESKIIAAVLLALLGGGAVKAVVNTLLPE